MLHVTCYMLHVFAASFTCPPNSFTCASNKEHNRNPCIPSYTVCDGDRNCDHGEDELQNCPPRKCRDGQFQCNNSICITAGWVCDRDNDCGDMSDEPANCSEFKCSSVRWLFSKSEISHIRYKLYFSLYCPI